MKQQNNVHVTTFIGIPRRIGFVIDQNGAAFVTKIEFLSHFRIPFNLHQ